MRIAFWNTYKNKEINQYLHSLIIENNIDILVLAEYEANTIEFEKLVRVSGIEFLQYFAPGCDRISIYGKYEMVDPGYQNTYFSSQVINDKYILCCVHLPSKLNGDRLKKDIVIRNIVEEVENLERKLNIDNTIIVGDFNENPYELGCLGADRFHGVPIYTETIRNFRVIMQERFKMFYNPMWNLLGDFSYPPGTYYYSGNEVENSFWNMYDQVMIRPCMRDKFIDEELKIIYKTKMGNLIDKNKHPSKLISDHLPIVFEIKEN